MKTLLFGRRSNHLHYVTIRCFTIIEMLAAIAVLTILLLIVTNITSLTSKTVRQGTAQIDSFQSGREGFDIITRALSQATLNTYWDYDDPKTPTRYVRNSDLHFIISTTANGQSLFFQIPDSYSHQASYQRTDGLLNACGFYVEFNNNSNRKPSHVTEDRWRYRLMQGIVPTEQANVLYTKLSSWTNSVIANTWPIDDNVIAIIALPRLSSTEDPLGTQLSSDYTYDSRGTIEIQWNQLPPQVELTLIAIDEFSAQRLANGSNPPKVITSALANKFKQVNLYAKDIKDIKDTLSAANITCRIFNATVTIQESKWSQ